MGGGVSGAHVIWLTLLAVQGEVGGGAAAHASLASLGLRSFACWRGNRRQRWSWRCGGHFSRVVFMRRRRWRIGGGRGVVTVLAPARWC